MTRQVGASSCSYNNYDFVPLSMTGHEYMRSDFKIIQNGG
jgi:hypothetical protein